MGARHVATLPDASELEAGRLSAWCAITQETSPLGEVLAAWGMMRPSGVLVLEARPHADPWATWAFVVIDGAVRGAQGPAALGDLAEWLPERCRRGHLDMEGLSRGANSADGLEHPVLGSLAGQYVRERLLDQLLACNVAGARASFFIGGLAWHDHLAPERWAPSFEHLILEHARRTDEWPGLRNTLGDLDTIAVPRHTPALTMRANLAEIAAIRGDGPGFERPPGRDFVDGPDAAASEEWKDVRWVYGLCDGRRSLADVVQHSLLGRYRTAAALATLVRCGNVELVADCGHGGRRVETSSSRGPSAAEIAAHFGALDEEEEMRFEAVAPLIDLDHTPREPWNIDDDDDWSDIEAA